MRFPRCLHPWKLTPAAAREWQRRLATRVEETPLPRPPRFIAGLDCAFADGGATCVAGVVVWDAEADRVTEEVVVRRAVSFPYVSGLLSFREVPALLAALRRLGAGPDLLLCDGQGRAHPRRFGLACHLGVLTGLPSAGCAKSRLTGRHAEPGPAAGASADLTDRGEVIGRVLRTRSGVRPVYVSAGHRCDLPGAVAVVLACLRGRRLPEPTWLADRLVARARTAA